MAPIVQFKLHPRYIIVMAFKRQTQNGILDLIFIVIYLTGRTAEMVPIFQFKPSSNGISKVKYQPIHQNAVNEGHKKDSEWNLPDLPQSKGLICTTQ